MALTVTHPFVSLEPAKTDPAEVGGADWNATHSLSGTLPVANGGTAATTAGDARTNLGLGTIATQNSNNVSITGGTVSGITLSSLDSNTTIQDNADPTKQLKFELSGITAGQTRTLTVPDGSGTLLSTASTVTVAQGGTGVATLTGIAVGNGTSAFTAAVSGTDIKTINGSSILGSGDLTIGAGGISDGDKGDITVSGSGATWTIDNDVVTFAKMQNINTAKVLGRTTASTGDVEELDINSFVLANGTVPMTGNLSLGAGLGVVFEGTTADDFETTLSAGEPTADRTVTLPNATDTLVGKATTDTFTNKSISLTTNTVTGTKAEFNTACSDGNFLYVGDVTADVVTSSNNAFTGANTFTNSTGQTYRQAATQDGILLRGRAGGTSSYTVEFVPAALGGNRTVTVPDESFTIGYRNIPAVGTKTGSYSLATADVGKYVQIGTGGSITIPDATFAEGDVISLFNNTTGNITITCSITTAYIAGTDSDKATMTLATRGTATILFISGTVCVVSGNVS